MCISLCLSFSAVLVAQDLTHIRELKQLWKFDEAVAVLSRMMEDSGDQTMLLEELADCYYQSGNTAEALMAYTRLVEQHPDDLRYKIRQLSLLYRGKQYDAAVRVGREIMSRDSITQVLVMVGDAFNTLEDKTSAEHYYRRALARQTHNESILNKLSGLLLDREQYDEVIALTDKFLEEDPENLTILPVSGVALYCKEDFPRAESRFLAMKKLGEDSYAVHFYLAQCAQKIGLYADAEREFILAWQRDSSNVGVPLSIGKLQSDRGVPGWENWYEKALEMLRPDKETLALTATAHQNYALAAMRRGKYDLAIREYRDMLDYDARHYSAYYLIAQCYEYKKDYKSALEWFKKAQGFFRPGSRGREIADAGVDRMTQELFMHEEKRQ